jgi:hypothetical protein
MLNSQIINLLEGTLCSKLTVEPLHGIDFPAKFIAKVTVSFIAKWSIILHIVTG